MSVVDEGLFIPCITALSEEQILSLIIASVSADVRRACLSELGLRYSKYINHLKDRIDTLENVCMSSRSQSACDVKSVVVCNITGSKFLIHLVGSQETSIIDIPGPTIRANVEALLHAYSMYNNAKYYQQSDFIFKVFPLWIDRWESNNYATRAGDTVKNSDLFKILYERGMRYSNVHMMKKEHYDMVDNIRRLF